MSKWLAAAVLLGSPFVSVAMNATNGKQIYWGVFVPDSYNGLAQFEADAGRSVSVQMWFQDWNINFDGKLMAKVRAHGAIPMLTWQPALPGNQDRTLNQIYSGKYDWYINQNIAVVKSFGHPVFIRLGHEMNGNWYPWSELKNNNQPGEYVRMWKHVVDMFRQQGANNANWVWCPNVYFPGSTDMHELYPGDDYVDWTCLDGYNFNNPWMSFHDIFADSYNRITALAPSKPLYIGETASSSNGGDKGKWIYDMLLGNLPTDFPKIQGFTWFNINKEQPWQIESSTESQSAFKDSINRGYYAANWYGNIEGKIRPLNPTLFETVVAETE
jgi:hypothetical protein